MPQDMPPVGGYGPVQYKVSCFIFGWGSVFSPDCYDRKNEGRVMKYARDSEYDD